MSFRNNLKWSSVGTIARYLIQTASIVVLARILTPIDFGVVSASLVIINFLTTLAQFGAAQLIVTTDEDKLGAVVFQSLLLSTVLSLCFMTAVYVFADYVSNAISHEDISNYIKMLIPVIFFKSITTTFEGIQVKKARFKYIAIASSASFIVGYFFVALILALCGMQLWSLIIATLVQTLLYLLILISSLSKLENIIVISFQHFIDNLKKSILISYSQMVSNLTGQVDNYFVSKFIGLETLGIYSRAYQLMVVPCNFIGQMVNQVFLKEFTVGNEIKNSKIIKQSLLLITLMSFFVVSVVHFLGRDLIFILLGSGWEAIQVPLLILSLSIYPRMLYKIGEPILYSNRSFSSVAIYSSIYFSIIVILLIALVSHGVSGIAVAVLLGTIIYGLSMSIKVVRLYPDTKRTFGLTLAIYIVIVGMVFIYG
ncbi:oligosaccharide flippase family protein [Citrobacter koseri]|uniref:oligosaccharide flippase family protein n=1 Tax=Citrobacter koseri TaxID=545 RepID=UPI00389172AB